MRELTVDLFCTVDGWLRGRNIDRILRSRN